MSVSALKSFAVLSAICAGVGLASNARAADVTWGGTYRVEAVKVKNPDLTADSNKAYLLHHLVLMPKVVASDGLTIHSRLDVLNDNIFGVDASGRVYSTAGDVIGNGPGNGPNTGTTNSTETNAWGRTQRAGNIAVTSLYLSWVQEFGQLVVGRTPLHFGLGTGLNAGNGQFDHFIDTRDLVGYKMVFGNLSLFPMLGKTEEGNLGDEDDSNDYIVQLAYENPETELALGVLYQLRIGTTVGNDAVAGGSLGGTGATTTQGYKNTLIGLFSTQKIGDFKVGLEADLFSGDTGVTASAANGGGGVTINSFGIAGEVGYAPADSKLTSSLKLGVASGDDPGTADVYEGFVFNRNYDVALLMFNHPLGQRDFLRTDIVRNPNLNARSDIDTEAISNALYFAPSLQYRMSDNSSWGGTFIYGMLNKDPIAGSGTASDLGYELDLNYTLKPFERLTWVTEAGFLFPGSAWKGGSLGLDAKFAYGLVTKAAISF